MLENPPLAAALSKVRGAETQASGSQPKGEQQEQEPKGAQQDQQQKKDEGAKKDEEKKDEPMPPSTSTSAATASPGGSGPSSSPPAESLTFILEYVRFIVRNLVPISSELFKPTTPAELLHDTKFAAPFNIYFRPLQLVWLFDLDASNRRATLADTPSYKRLMPSLPYWMMASDGKDECVPRSLMLADVSASLDAGKPLADDWKTAMFELRRSRVTGSALEIDKEAAILADYRKMSVSPLLRGLRAYSRPAVFSFAVCLSSSFAFCAA